jgi:hypothetical protein
MGLFSRKKKVEKTELPPISDLVKGNLDNVEEKSQVEIPEYKRVDFEESGDLDTSSSKQDVNLFEMDEDIGTTQEINLEETIAEPQLNYGTSNTNGDSKNLKFDNEEREKFEKDYTISKKSEIKKEFYVTTTQFKDLLDIVDSVKLKIKSTNELYLRLADIKSEEDIEFENLRKSFIFVEEKLYELDRVLFSD